MSNYNLTPNEGIIIQKDGVYHNGEKSKIILTNKNLICLKIDYGLFKETQNVLKFPVNQIKIINGQAQATVIKKGDISILKIAFKTRTEEFEFRCDLFEQLFMQQQEADKWVEQISVLLTGNSASNLVDTSLIGGITGGVTSILDSIGLGAKPKEPESVTIKCSGCSAIISGERGQIVRCKYCDTNQKL